MRASLDAWQLVQRGGQIDAMQFLRSLRSLAAQPTLEPRDQLLLRDGLHSIARLWGQERLQQELKRLDFSPRLQQRADQSSDEGFHTLEARVADVTDPEKLFQMLTDLGRHVRQPTTIIVGGSLSLMLELWISRLTDDVDLVDEVPAALRNDPELLQLMVERYGLRLSHFQSHYLPTGWEKRLRSLGQFGGIKALRVDPMDVLVGKLFSRRHKDMNDLVQAWSMIDKNEFRERLTREGKTLANDPHFAEPARSNWNVLFGKEPFPL